MFSDIHMVFEFMEFDMFKLFESSLFLTITQVISVAQQILSGVHFMHAANVIHRDIKPENILISIKNPSDIRHDRLCDKSQIIVKIADFGLARVIGEEDILLKKRSKSIFDLWLCVQVVLFILFILRIYECIVACGILYTVYEFGI